MKMLSLLLACSLPQCGSMDSVSKVELKRDVHVNKHLWQIWRALPFADGSKTVKMMQEALDEQ